MAKLKCLVAHLGRVMGRNLEPDEVLEFEINGADFEQANQYPGSAQGWLHPCRLVSGRKQLYYISRHLWR